MDYSVIIPTYNRAHVLSRCLNSILNQSLLPKEIFVADDGSTDATSAVVAQFFKKAKRIGVDLVHLRLAHRGVSYARNSALSAVSCDWVAFLDSDDEWLPKKMEVQAASLVRSQNEFGHCDEEWIRNGVRVNPMNKHRKGGGYIFEQCLPLCVVSPSAVVAKKKLIQHYGGFDESFPVCEDYALWLRICKDIQVDFVAQPLLRKYGGHEDQLSRQLFAMDYWRLKAISAVYCKLNSSQKAAAKATFAKKQHILASGFRKHDKPFRALMFERLQPSEKWT